MRGRYDFRKLNMSAPGHQLRQSLGLSIGGPAVEPHIPALPVAQFTQPLQHRLRILAPEKGQIADPEQLPDSWALAPSGHAAEPPSSMMKSRRFN
jgi:hypothetical protein